MYQYTARPLSVDAVLHAASSKGKQRGATEVSGSAQKVQNLVVKQQLHNQMVQLREAFLREDQRISGTIPTYQLASCLRAGGLELDAVQTKEAHWKFMTGEGRFHWLRFCEHIEKARSKAWSQQSRIKSAKAFADIDKDGSSMLSRDEIETALTKWNVPYTDDKLDRIFTSCDKDGDGNISYPEFVDGMARDLVAPSSIWDAAATQAKLQSPRSGSPRSPRFAPSLARSTLR